MSRKKSPPEAPSATKPRSYKLIGAVLLLCAMLGFLGGSLLFVDDESKLSHEDAFNSLVENMLQVKSLTNDVSLETEFLTLDQRILYDFSNPDSTRTLIRATNTVDFFISVTSNVQLVSIGDDIYIRYESIEFDDEFDDEFASENDELDALIGKWIKVAGKGVKTTNLPDNLDPSSLLNQTDVLASGILLGNIEEQKRLSLVDSLRQFPVYSYEGEVVEEQIDESSAYRYAVRINEEHLERIKQQINEDPTAAPLEEREFKLSGIDEIYFWIDSRSGLLVKASFAIENEQLGRYEVESFYRDYDVPVIIEPPQSFIPAQQITDTLDVL